VDECATAADIYQCGLKKDPNLVNALIMDTAGSTSVSKFLKVYCLIIAGTYIKYLLIIDQLSCSIQ
jgi:hypothetical protein